MILMNPRLLWNAVLFYPISQCIIAGTCFVLVFISLFASLVYLSQLDSDHTPLITNWIAFAVLAVAVGILFTATLLSFLHMLRAKLREVHEARMMELNALLQENNLLMAILPESDLLEEGWRSCAWLHLAVDPLNVYIVYYNLAPCLQHLADELLSHRVLMKMLQKTGPRLRRVAPHIRGSLQAAAHKPLHQSLREVIAKHILLLYAAPYIGCLVNGLLPTDLHSLHTEDGLPCLCIFVQFIHFKTKKCPTL
ncbi:hypothetical protein Ciccas_009313 [Cichlidogyrus casuarinus]|uniref:Uncharacterized protein n=1 Tax=Cichlidogyrus casuarinus TaxID=1844966 RepID=A0ABD2Q1U3_9PLAT